MRPLFSVPVTLALCLSALGVSCQHGDVRVVGALGVDSLALHYEATGRLAMFDIETGRTTTLADGVQAPFTSPAGDAVFCLAEAQGGAYRATGELRVFEVDAKVWAVIRAGVAERSWEFDPSGRYLRFTGPGSMMYDTAAKLWVLDRVTRRVHAMPGTGGFRQPRFLAGTGAVLAYRRWLPRPDGPAVDELWRYDLLTARGERVALATRRPED